MKATMSALRFLLPTRVRRLAFLQAVKNSINIRLLGHDGVYDDQYYREIVDPTATKSAPVIADTVTKTLRPGSLIDVGCGTGALMLAFKKKDIPASLWLRRGDRGRVN